MAKNKIESKEFGNSLNDFIDRVERAFTQIYYDYSVREVFDSSVIVYSYLGDRQSYKVGMVVSQDKKSFTFALPENWVKVKLDYVQEMVLINNVTELSSAVPEVPFRPDVNLSGLTEGDENPFFLTLEIANKDAVSGNGLVYDQTLLTSLVTQINTMPIEGLMGHLKSSDRASSFEPSDIHWLGAAEQNGKVYAKGYMPKTAIAEREHFRILQFTGGKAATSIYGWANAEPVDVKQGTWRASVFDLEQLDLAPYTRAALKPTSNGFTITSELETDNTLVKEKNKVDEKDNNTQVSELETLKKQIEEYKKKDFTGTVSKIVSETITLTTANKTGIDAIAKLQKLVSDYAQLVASTEDEVKIVVEQISDDLGGVMALLVQALAGPKAVIPSDKVADNKLVDTPENRAKARSQFGLVN